MTAIYNFSAGPAMLPQSVLQQAQAELLNYQGGGVSVMSMSHRSEPFMQIAQQAEANMRQLMDIPDNYKVLFLQGGATTQFALLPMNIAQADSVADYVCTGIWSKKASVQAKPLLDVNIAASGENEQYTSIPALENWQLSDKAAYLHIADNETIGGVEFIQTLNLPVGTTLVADISSSIFSKAIDVSRYGVLYAGAQKNIGPAGLTVVIIREDLLDRGRADLPPILSYRAHADAGSMLNTPPTYSWYIAGLVFQWLIEQGGVSAIAKVNADKAARLYAAIDDSGFYSNPVDHAVRSRMNVPFTLAQSDLDKTFLDEAKAAGLLNLKGHRSVGGMRASIYNAMPLAGITALIDFMQDFEKRMA